MAYNTREIVTDVSGNPVSQYYNPDTDQYEPVKGSGGGNRVVLYNEDGTENNELSLIPILEKLSQLTGTVIDEETRKSNELQRILFYNQLQQMLADGELKGDKGDTGIGLEFDWQGTSLGVRLQGETEYIYIDLRGPKGDKGDTGNMENLNAQHIEDALGYIPTDEDIVGMLANLTTDEKANLVGAINEVKLQSNDIATNQTTHVAKVVSHGLGVTRSVGVDGIQVIALPFKAKSIIVFASIDTTKMMSNGLWAENGYQRGKAVAGDTGILISIASAVGLHSSDTNKFEGLIQNVTEAGFEIKWTTTGSFTGTVSVYAIASTH